MQKKPRTILARITIGGVHYTVSFFHFLWRLVTFPFKIHSAFQYHIRLKSFSLRLFQFTSILVVSFPSQYLCFVVQSGFNMYLFCICWEFELETLTIAFVHALWHEAVRSLSSKSKRREVVSTVTRQLSNVYTNAPNGWLYPTVRKHSTTKVVVVRKKKEKEKEKEEGTRPV